MLKQVRIYIDKLQLQPHPEGGYYKEVYRAGEMILAENLPGAYNGDRNISTSIYFLLQQKDFSAFHKLKSDELWHFYDGTSVKISVIDQDGNFKEIFLGKHIDEGAVFQTVIKKNCWFAAELIDKKSFALVGCTVSPGFDFSDFEMADCEQLIRQFPELKDRVIRLCRPKIS
ncbi:MAG: cupin domain-containing protein [Ignavibacteriaceae bacterium]